MAKTSFSMCTVAFCLQVLMVILSRDALVIAQSGTVPGNYFDAFLHSMMSQQAPTDTAQPTDPYAPLPNSEPTGQQTSPVLDTTGQQAPLITDTTAQQAPLITDPFVPQTSQITDTTAQQASPIIDNNAQPTQDANTNVETFFDPNQQLLGSPGPVETVPETTTTAATTPSPVVAEVSTPAPVTTTANVNSLVSSFLPTSNSNLLFSGNPAPTNTAPVSGSQPAAPSFTDQLASTFNMPSFGGNTFTAFKPPTFDLLGSMATTPAPISNSFGMFGSGPTNSQPNMLFGSLRNTFPQSQPNTKPAAATPSMDPFAIMKRILSAKKAAQLAKQSTNVAYHEQFGCVPAPVPCFKPQAQMMCNRVALRAGGKPSMFPTSMMPPMMQDMYRTLEQCLSPKSIKKNTMSPFSMLTGMMSAMNRPAYNAIPSNTLASPAASIPGSQGPSLLNAAAGSSSLQGGSMFGPSDASFMSSFMPQAAPQPQAQAPVDCTMIRQMMLMKMSASGEPMQGPEAMEMVGQMRKQFLPYTCQEVDVSSMPPALKRMQYFLPASAFPSMTLQYSMCCPGKVEPPTKMEKLSFMMAEQGA
nr:putative lineage-restricted protein [Crepidula fornicata]